MLVLVQNLAVWVIPGFLAVVLIFAFIRRVNVFEAFVEGAAEGLPVGVRLVPYLVAMIVAVGMFRDSGAMELVSRGLLPVLSILNIPAEILPLALMRPVSGSSALAITTEIMQSYGPDSFLGRLASTMQGSTETTLFVLTVYFGSVGIRKTRHALSVGLIGDVSGFLASVLICTYIFSS